MTTLLGFLIERLAKIRATWERQIPKLDEEFRVKDGRESLIFHRGYCHGVVEGIGMAMEKAENMRKWEGKLRIVERSKVTGAVEFRPATWWEKVRYWLGLPARQEGWQELREGERIVRR